MRVILRTMSDVRGFPASDFSCLSRKFQYKVVNGHAVAPVFTSGL
jgi:hypothetical protein